MAKPFDQLNSISFFVYLFSYLINLAKLLLKWASCSRNCRIRAGHSWATAKRHTIMNRTPRCLPHLVCPARVFVHGESPYQIHVATSGTTSSTSASLVIISLLVPPKYQYLQGLGRLDLQQHPEKYSATPKSTRVIPGQL